MFKNETDKYSAFDEQVGMLIIYSIYTLILLSMLNLINYQIPTSTTSWTTKN